MEFIEEDYPKEDCLKICRILTIDIFQNKIVKLLLVFTLFIYSAIVLLQTYSFIVSFDYLSFLLYAPFYFSSFFIIIAIAGTLAITHHISESLQKLKLWKVDHADRKIVKKIQNKSKFLQAYVVYTTTLTLVTCCFHMFPSEEERALFYAFEIFEKYFPKWKDELSWIFLSCFLLLALVMPANFNQFVYVSSHVIFQIYILSSYAQKVDVACGDRNDLELTYNKTFQKKAEEFFITITALKWYLWNKENKQIYSIILANAIKPASFKFSERISVNFELGVGIGKLLYSVLSFLKQLK
ncbi:hypothetical protein BDFB_010840 [Asbolus verrucosus]|uniref:7tm 6 domain containing protein n=1 Tax=Asbolus verrucosus TaxID=1661398 RepID=A0A482VJU3_ASBVE|nr:hypothetical protein BDFB_010840 [Asbolus verrucosus]